MRENNYAKIQMMLKKGKNELLICVYDNLDELLLKLFEFQIKCFKVIFEFRK